MSADRYKYFRIEAGELLDGLGQGLLALGRGEDAAAHVDRLLRLAHTLKGAARVVGQVRISGHAHDLEGLLLPGRNAAGPISHGIVNEGLALLDAIARDVAALSPPEATRAAPEESFETVRVELPAMGTLLAGLFETRTQVDGLKRRVDALHRARRLAAGLARELRAEDRHSGDAEALVELLAHLAADLESGVDQVAVDLAIAHERADRMRLLPVSAMFSYLERVARDAAEAEGKQVAFAASGGDTRVDGHVLLRMRDALVHVVRNAIAHGVESERERRAAGKAPVGRVTLHVERTGRHVRFRCQDDGRGIDPNELRDAAVAAGLKTPAAAGDLDDEAALTLVFESGFTTARAASQLAGRGIGLHAVREAIRSLDGQVRLESAASGGATLTAVVPVSLASLPALLVEADGLTAAIPLDSVVGAARISAAEIIRAGDRETVVFEGRALPFMPLACAWGRQAPARRPRESVVAVRTEGRLAAIGVDRVRDTREVVVRPLPASIGELPLLTGVVLDAAGPPVPTLDPAALVAVAAGATAPRCTAAAPPQAPILVIDDSLTTRMLEKTILESAGFEVALATSAEEALAMIDQRPYRMFIVDVEMPSMNGFEFVARTRQDDRQRTIPAVLVTSLGAAADRRRGAEVGAQGYIVKSEFEQEAFVALVRRLVG